MTHSTEQVDNRPMGWSLAALGMLLVSTDSLFIRLSEANGWDVAFLVSLFSLPVMFALQARFESGSPVERFRAAPGPLVLVAALAGVSHITFIAAVTRTDVANVVVIVAAAPILAALFAWVALRERTTVPVAIAIAITLGGVVIVVAGSVGTSSLDGDLLAVVAIVTFAANMVVWRRHPGMSRYVGLALSALLVMVVTAPFADPTALDGRAYVSIAAMGFVFSPAGRIAYSNAPRYAPTAEVALFTPVETVAAPLWAWMAFSEVPATQTVVGGGVVLVGVLFGTVASRRIAKLSLAAATDRPG